jgi:glycerophosphoryl diester phosphodiesterase
LARGRVRLDIELKAAGFERTLVRLLADHGLSAADVIVTSFDPKVVSRVTQIDADVLTGLLVEDTTTSRAIDLYFECGADVLAPRHDMVSPALLSEAEREEVMLLPWPVNDPVLMAQLFASNAVLGLITDAVAEAARVRAAMRA